jgi:DNA-binding MarR family transcriptional regulator
LLSKYDSGVPDEIDGFIEQWRDERPDLGADLEAMALFGRLGRLAAVAGAAIEEVLLRHGLTTGEFDVLAALRRAGPPFTLTPTVLARTLMLSPAAMTNRLDRLERAGLVTRSVDAGNRRSTLVALAAAGRTSVDAAVGEHLANEVRLLGGLTAAQRRTLDELLRLLLATLSDPARQRCSGEIH